MAAKLTKPTATMSDILAIWDELDNTTQKVETSLPWQLSENIAKLVEARMKMRGAMQSFCLSAAGRAALEPPHDH